MRIRSIVAGTTALALLAGCGTGTTGTPTTASPPTSTSNSGGAPRIGDPLDVKSFVADPCSAITAAQIQAFGLPGVSGRNNTSAVGSSCVWLGASSAGKMAPGITLLPDGTDLRTILPNKDSTYQYFEPRPAVQSYPAYIALAVDQRKDGGCELLVGVADDKAFLFTFSSFSGSPKFADPCAAVTEFADLAITTIKAGAK